MSDEMITIEGHLRTETGKGAARKIRKNGMVPGIILGKGGPSTAITLKPKFLHVAWKGGKKFNLDLDGEVKPVKIQELQINPAKRVPLHVDLMVL